jgi:hypothetical protein
MATNTNRKQALMAAELEKNFRITLYIFVTSFALTYVKRIFLSTNFVPFMMGFSSTASTDFCCLG